MVISRSARAAGNLFSNIKGMVQHVKSTCTKSGNLSFHTASCSLTSTGMLWLANTHPANKLIFFKRKKKERKNKIYLLVGS